MTAIADIIKRFSNYSFDKNNIFISEDGFMAANQLNEDFIESIEYERPYFNAPSLQTEAGKSIVFLSLVEDRLKELDYHKEAKEVYNLYSKILRLNKSKQNTSYENFLEIAFLYVDFKDFYKKIVVEEEIFYKLKSNSDKVNKKIFCDLYNFKINNNNISDINKNFFTQEYFDTNIYGRNALFYINNVEQLNAFYEKSKERDTVFEDFFCLDNFSQVPLHNCHKDIFTRLLEICIDIDKNFTKRVLDAPDKLDIVPLAYHSLNDDIIDYLKIFLEDNKKFDTYFEVISNFAKKYNTIRKVDSYKANLYKDSVLNEVKKDLTEKRDYNYSEENKVKLEKQMDKILIMLEKEILNNSINMNNNISPISFKKI